MGTKQVAVPEELLALLRDSRLATRDTSGQVKAVLAIHLFLEGLVSIGKAAELADVPRVEFEWLLVEMGLPAVRHEVAEYEQDLSGFADAERRRGTA